MVLAAFLTACAIPALGDGVRRLHTESGVGVGGYGQSAWASHALVEVARAAPVGGRSFSNYPEVVYLHTGRRTERTPRSTSQPPWRLEQAATEGPVWMLWFEEGREGYRSVDEIASRLRLEVELAVESGTLYRAYLPMECLTPTAGSP
jgi:hypothetical protein